MAKKITTFNGTPWIHKHKLILASSSRTRRMLLESALIPVRTIKPDVDERKLESNNAHLAPYQIAILLAKAKAQSIAESFKSHIIVGADQVLEFKGQIYHKPQNEKEAVLHLKSLRGHTHTLYSSVSVAYDGQVFDSFVDSASMTVRYIDDDAIKIYIKMAAKLGILSSVGAYHFESLGIHLFSEVSGHHSTILGLPLIPLLQRFRDIKLLSF